MEELENLSQDNEGVLDNYLISLKIWANTSIRPINKDYNSNAVVVVFIGSCKALNSRGLQGTEKLCQLVIFSLTKFFIFSTM